MTRTDLPPKTQTITVQVTAIVEEDHRGVRWTRYLYETPGRAIITTDNVGSHRNPLRVNEMLLKRMAKFQLGENRFELQLTAEELDGLERSQAEREAELARVRGEVKDPEKSRRELAAWQANRPAL